LQMSFGSCCLRERNLSVGPRASKDRASIESCNTRIPDWATRGQDSFPGRLSPDRRLPGIEKLRRLGTQTIRVWFLEFSQQIMVPEIPGDQTRFSAPLMRARLKTVKRKPSKLGGVLVLLFDWLRGCQNSEAHHKSSARRYDPNA
jgi:hypothetical protein